MEIRCFLGHMIRKARQGFLHSPSESLFLNLVLVTVATFVFLSFGVAKHAQVPDFVGQAHKNQLEMQIVILIQSKVSQLNGKQLENAKFDPGVNSSELCLIWRRLCEMLYFCLAPVGFQCSTLAVLRCKTMISRLCFFLLIIKCWLFLQRPQAKKKMRHKRRQTTMIAITYNSRCSCVDG